MTLPLGSELALLLLAPGTWLVRLLSARPALPLHVRCIILLLWLPAPLGVADVILARPTLPRLKMPASSQRLFFVRWNPKATRVLFRDAHPHTCRGSGALPGGEPVDDVTEEALEAERYADLDGDDAPGGSGVGVDRSAPEDPVSERPRAPGDGAAFA